MHHVSTNHRHSRLACLIDGLTLAFNFKGLMRPLNRALQSASVGRMAKQESKIL